MMRRSGVLKFYSQCKQRFVFQLEFYIDVFQGAVLSALLFFCFYSRCGADAWSAERFFLKSLQPGLAIRSLLNLFGQHKRAVKKFASAEYSKAESKPAI